MITYSFNSLRSATNVSDVIVDIVNQSFCLSWRSCDLREHMNCRASLKSLLRISRTDDKCSCMMQIHVNFDDNCLKDTFIMFTEYLLTSLRLKHFCISFHSLWFVYEASQNVRSSMQTRFCSLLDSFVQMKSVSLKLWSIHFYHWELTFKRFATHISFLSLKKFSYRQSQSVVWRFRFTWRSTDLRISRHLCCNRNESFKTEFFLDFSLRRCRFSLTSFRLTLKSCCLKSICWYDYRSDELFKTDVALRSASKSYRLKWVC